MTDRTNKKIEPMKEYGRKPYLVTPTTVPLGEEADYRYMMDKTWQKAQDDAHIVVQSVKKKPYQEQDYQSMENTADGYTNIDWHMNWNWYRPKFSWKAGQNNTTAILPPEDPDREEERKADGVLRWTQCPTTVSPSKSYTIIVRNSYIISRQYTNGRLRNTQTETIPSQISIVPKTSAAKGLSITYVKDMGGSTRATLQTSSYATGEFYIYATSRRKEIYQKITVARGTIYANIDGTIYDRNGNIISGTFGNITTTQLSPASVTGSLPSGYTLVVNLPGVRYHNFNLPFGNYSIHYGSPAEETETVSAWHNNEDSFWVAYIDDLANGHQYLFLLDASTNNYSEETSVTSVIFCS